jgi:hypothetical protein
MRSGQGCRRPVRRSRLSAICGALTQRGHTKQLSYHSVRDHAFFAAPLIATGTVIEVWKRRYRNEEFSFSRAMARAYRGLELQVSLAAFGIAF